MKIKKRKAYDVVKSFPISSNTDTLRESDARFSSIVRRVRFSR